MSDHGKYLTPEARARVNIDRMLEAAGWVVQDGAEQDLYAGPGVAVREFLLEGNNEADYLLFVNRQAVGEVRSSHLFSRRFTR